MKVEDSNIFEYCPNRLVFSFKHQNIIFSKIEKIVLTQFEFRTLMQVKESNLKINLRESYVDKRSYNFFNLRISLYFFQIDPGENIAE